MDNENLLKHIGQFCFFLGILFFVIDFMSARAELLNPNITYVEAQAFVTALLYGYGYIIYMIEVQVGLIVVGLILWFISRYFKEKTKPEREEGKVNINISQANVPTNV